MNEDNEPDWLAELAKGSEALQREAIRLVKAAEEFAASGPVRPLTRGIVRVVSAGIREFAEPDPTVGYVTAIDAAGATKSFPVVRTIEGRVSFGLPRISVSGEGTVQQLDLIERNVGRIFALALLTIATAGLLGVHAQDQASVGYYAGVIFGALSVAFAICSGFK